MNASPLLVEALVYLAAGVLAVPLAHQAGLGAVLGYLVAGVLIGPFALGLVGGQAAVMQFAEFGVVILLFLIGLEVRPALLWRLRFDIAGLGLAQLLGAAVAIGLAAWAAGLPPRAAIASGVILAMSSTAVTLQLLDENGLRRGAVGTSAFGVLLFQDLSVIPLFALLPLLACGGGHALPAGGSAGGHGLLEGVPAPIRAAAELAAVLSVVLGGRLLTRPAFRFIAAAKLREIFTATALLIVVGVAALMEIVGLSPALGTFLAGVMLAESEFRRELETDIEPFRGLLLGLFFMTVGASVDLRLLLHHPLLLLGAVAVLLGIKTLVMLLIGRMARLPWRDALTVAVALAEGGEFAFVLVSAAVGASVIDRQTGALLVATVALSMLASPALFRLTRSHTRPVGKRGATGSGAAETHPAFEEGADAIVAGYGRVGQIVGRLLRSAGIRCTVLDVSMSTIETIRALGGRVEYGDATRLDLLEAAGARTARLLVVAIDDRERATELVTLARTTFPNLTVVARAWDRQHAYALMEQGAAHVERETYEGSLALGRAALRALGYRAHRAQRVSALFRLYDSKQFDRMRTRRGEARPAFLLAARESADMFAELLAADLAAIGGGDAADTEWSEAGAEAPRLP